MFGPDETTLQEYLDELIAERYGRDGDILARGYRLTVQELGYATGLMWWGAREALDDALSDFQREHLEGRLDVLFDDLLTHPDDPPTREWARRYGFSDRSAVSRAIKARHGLGVGDVRRMGRLGQWLALAERSPRLSAGRQRRAEAEQRLAAFRAATSKAQLGSRAQRALRRLGTGADATRRPRYPAIGAAERRRLEGVVAR